MEHKPHLPLLLLTLSFVVGVALAWALNIDLWVSLTIFMAGGALSLFRGWSVGLLMMSVAVGGVRVHFEGEQAPRSYVSQGVQWDEESLFGRVNFWAQDRVEALELSGRGESLLKAMLLGDRSKVDSTQRREYGYSGASHILAVSGLHLSVIFLFVNWILLPLVLLPRGHILRGVVVVALVWIYAGVVGFSPSVVRGAAMFSILYFAFILGRPYSGVNALLGALLGCVVVVPSILYSVGFQLSVISVAAIFLWAQPLYYKFFGGGGVLVMALSIGGACSVATMPIVSHIFGYIPLLGVFVSPLFIATSFVIICSGVVWILFPVAIVAPVVRLVVEFAALVQDSMVGWVASKWWGVLDFRLSDFGVALMYLIYIVVTILVWGFGDNRDK